MKESSWLFIYNTRILYTKEIESQYEILYKDKNRIISSLDNKKNKQAIEWNFI